MNRSCFEREYQQALRNARTCLADFRQATSRRGRRNASREYAYWAGMAAELAP